MNSSPLFLKTLLKSINHAKNFLDITEEQIKIILTCRKSTLSDNKSTWIKNYTDNFDVLMDADDSAQIADLIGIYVFDTQDGVIIYSV